MSPGSRAPGSPIGTKSSLNSNSASGSGLSTQPLGNSPGKRIGCFKIRNTQLKNSSTYYSYFHKILILARHGPIGSRPNAQNSNSQAAVSSAASAEPQPVTSSNSAAPDSVSLAIIFSQKSFKNSNYLFAFPQFQFQITSNFADVALVRFDISYYRIPASSRKEKP